MSASSPPVAAGTFAPYRGLMPFGESELDVFFFFGRDREREIITANLMASRLTVLYGETGVGKSSVLRAGVAHALRSVGRQNLAARGEPELAVVLFDDWRDDPVPALAETVASSMREALGEALDPPFGQARLADRLEAWTALGGDLYLILDQVEDYFLYHEGEEGEGTFADELPELVGRPGLRVNVLLALREDTVAKLDRFKARIPNLFANYLRLDHLDRAAAREAIVEPLAQYGRLVEPDQRVEIEATLVEAVLDELATGRVELAQAGRGAVAGGTPNGRIETPYLQLVMERLWETERAEGSRLLRLSTFRELGGAQRIVEAHLEHALEALTQPECDIAAIVFDHLVTPSGTKIAHAARDLAAWAGAEEAVLLPVLSKLGAERILRSVPAADGSGGQRYEIFHDVLADGVLAWKSDYERRRQIKAQQAEAERRQRRLLRVIAGGALLLVLMAGVTVFALTQRSDARSQARLAHARELAATATSQLQVDPQKSLALAVEAAGVRRVPQVEDVLRQSLIESKERAILSSSGPVRDVSFSPDGSLVITASDDGTARLWRIDSRAAERVFRHPDAVTSTAFGPDGTLVVTSGADGTARIWRTQTGALLHVLRHGSAVARAHFSSDGSLVVTAGSDGTARIWQTATGTLRRTMRHKGPVRDASFSPDGNLVVTVASDPDGQNLRARIFSTRSGRLLRELPAPGVTTASFSPDGSLVITGSEDHTAAIWRVQDGVRLHLLADHNGGVTNALFGPGGRLAVTTSSDGATRAWDVRTGARVATMLGHVNAVLGAAFSPNGRFVITVSSDGTARVWEAANARFVAVLRGHGDAVVAGAFSPDGRRVVTGSLDGTARVWDPGTVPELRVFATEQAAVWSAAYSPDGSVVLAAGDDGVRLLTRDGRLLRMLARGAVARAAFAPDGRTVAGASGSSVRAWAAADGRLVASRRYRSAVASVSIGPHGELVTAEGDGTVRISGKRVFKERAPIASAALSPDATLVATAGADGTGRIRDARTGSLLHLLRGHTDALTDAEFSADGKFLVTASRDHDVRIWDVATGRPTALLRGHFGPVFGASFSPDGRWVVTAGPTKAGLWQASTGRLLLYLRVHVGGRTEPLTAASFSPDGRWILTAGRDGTVRVYRCTICGSTDELVGEARSRLAELVPRR